MKFSKLQIRSTRSRLWYVSAVCAFFLAAAVVPAQQTVVKYGYDQPITSQIYQNDCNSEQVLMNGNMHFEYFFSTDPDGDHTHYHVTSNTQLTGVGQTTGAQYVGKNSTNYNIVAKGSSASDFTNIEKTRLVAQGPTADMLLRQNTHVVVDAKGNIRANIDSSTISCK